jgi:hypothetical protein
MSKEHEVDLQHRSAWPLNLQVGSQGQEQEAACPAIRLAGGRATVVPLPYIAEPLAG